MSVELDRCSDFNFLLWVDLTNCFSNFSFFGSIFWVCSAVEELNSVVRRGVLSHFASVVFSRIVLS